MNSSTSLSMNTPVRYVGLHHIAFYRAAFEDALELPEIADRFLETGADLPAAKRTLKFVESALCQTALRHGKHGAAALLRVPRKRFREQALPEGAKAKPSLDEYRAEVDPGDFYSESELLELYKAEHGATALSEEINATPAQLRKQVRNARLLKRKIVLINTIAEEISKPPALEDLIVGWFDQRVANKFTGTSLATLGDLILFMNHRGYRWYRAIPRMGEVTARRILSFLDGSDLSGLLSPYAIIPREILKTSAANVNVMRPKDQTLIGGSIRNGGIVPLEEIKIPVNELNGSLGLNRAQRERNRLNRNDDLSAINAWLGLFSENTERSYRKEAERLLLWSIYQKQTAFSSLTTEDVGEYVQFLSNPQPTEKWVSDKRYPRFHPAWKPFVKSGLSGRSCFYAVQVLSTMCGWLVGQRYLDSNPFDGLPRMNSGKWQPSSRSLSTKQWNMIRDYLKTLPSDESSVRCRFLVALAFSTGMRIHELAKARVSDIRQYHFGSKSVWYLSIIGKGKKEREVPLPSSIYSLFITYLRARGHECDSPKDLPPEIPLFSHLGSTQTMLSTRSLDQIMKGLYNQVADRMDNVDPHSALVLRQASMHWMRHTHATHALQNNVPLESVRDNLGHASLTTTSIYVHTEMEDRHNEIEAFVGFI